MRAPCVRAHGVLASHRGAAPRRGGARRRRARAGSRARPARPAPGGRRHGRDPRCGVDRVLGPTLGASAVPGGACARAGFRGRVARSRRLLPRPSATPTGPERGDARPRSRGDLRLRARGRASRRGRAARCGSRGDRGRCRLARHARGRPGGCGRRARARRGAVDPARAARSLGSVARRRDRSGGGGRGRRSLGLVGDRRRPQCGRELGELGSARPLAGGHRRPLCVGRELRRHRVPAREDGRADRGRPGPGALLARLHARPLHRRPLVPEPPPARSDRRRRRRDARRPADTGSCEAGGELARAEDPGAGTRRRPSGRRGHAGRARLAGNRDRVPALGQRSPRSSAARRGSELPRLELRPRSRAGDARRVEAALPLGRAALPDAREPAVPGLRRAGAREPGAFPARRPLVRLAGRIPLAVRDGAPRRGGRGDALRGRSRARVLVQAAGRVQLRRVAAGRNRGRPSSAS